ncbi:hypothetical protein V6C27_10595 [Peptococcaceae bacterium 1198_IL3148]
MVRGKGKHNLVNNVSLVLKELVRTSGRGGSTLEELADLCGVSTRNVYRYLREIETMGFQLLRPSQVNSKNKGKGRYRLSAQVLQICQTDMELVMLINFYSHMEKQYREHLNLINEVFIRYLAGKNGLILPINWK